MWRNNVEKGIIGLSNNTLEHFTESPLLSENLSKWKVVKFADKLKDVVCLLTGCTRVDLEDHEFKSNRVFRFENKWYGSVREFLQYFGTDLIRKNLGDNIWVYATFVDYKPRKLSEYNPSKWIISDVRFPNEVEAIKDRNGIVIRINRNNSLFKSVVHESETALDDYDNFDYVINNDGSIGELVEKIKEILIEEKII